MKSTLFKSQRVGVLVDVQNLYYSARSLYHRKVNFENVLKDAVGNRTPIRAIAYVVKTEEFKEKTFFEALERIGYEIKAKDLQIFYGGNKKADWDVGLAMDAIELAAKLDVIVIVSGDGDYIPLVQHLKRAFGCKVEAMAFGKTTSSKLREEVDGFIDLDENSGRYLRKAIPFRENGKFDSKKGKEERAKSSVKPASRSGAISKVKSTSTKLVKETKKKEVKTKKEEKKSTLPKINKSVPKTKLKTTK